MTQASTTITTRAVSAPQPLDVSVVLPTYEEARSLPSLVPRILETLQGAGLTGEVGSERASS